MLTVKVVQVPGRVVELALEDGSTVAEAIEAANISISPNESLTLDGRPATASDTLYDGARIIAAKNAKSALTNA